MSAITENNNKGEYDALLAEVRKATLISGPKTPLQHQITSEEDLERLLEDIDKEARESEYLDDNSEMYNQNNANRIVQILDVRNEAAKNLQEQTRKMLKTSNKKYNSCVVGANVTVPIPDVDRARGSFRDVIAV
ncbi:hypothetical protein ILUMI_12720, partial [Ignelater luminosus]